MLGGGKGEGARGAVKGVVCSGTFSSCSVGVCGQVRIWGGGEIGRVCGLWVFQGGERSFKEKRDSRGR